MKLSWATVVWGLGIAFLLGGQVMLLATLVSRVEKLENTLSRDYATKEYVDTRAQQLRVEASTEHSRMWDAIGR